MYFSNSTIEAINADIASTALIMSCISFSVDSFFLCFFFLPIGFSPFL